MEEIEVKELIKHGNYNIIKICTSLALFLIFLIAKYGHRHYSYVFHCLSVLNKLGVYVHHESVG